MTCKISADILVAEKEIIFDQIQSNSIFNIDDSITSLGRQDRWAGLPGAAGALQGEGPRREGQGRGAAGQAPGGPRRGSYVNNTLIQYNNRVSTLIGRQVIVREPSLTHIFEGGECTCGDRWRWESRSVVPAPQADGTGTLVDGAMCRRE